MASAEAIAESARATSSIAKARAFVSKLVFSVRATCSAISFQWPALVGVPTGSSQNSAAAVWSVVRVALIDRPSAVTSLSAWSKAVVPTAGGAAGRNSDAPVRTNGRTWLQFGLKISPVEVVSADPSLFRVASVFWATSAPSDAPLRMAGVEVSPAAAAVKAPVERRGEGGEEGEQHRLTGGVGRLDGRRPGLGDRVTPKAACGSVAATTASYCAVWRMARSRDASSVSSGCC